MTDFDEVDGIITCPNCGARNRVGTFATSLRPVCGKCHISLLAAIETYRDRKPSTKYQTSPRPPELIRRTKLFVVIGIALAVPMLWAVIHFQTKPTLPQYAPTYAPNNRYVPFNPSAKPVPLPYEAPQINRRLQNGTIIRHAGLSGRGTLTVKNGLSLDAAAKLIDKQDNLCKAYFYVRAYDEVTLAGVNDGNYRLLFGIGEDWDQTTQFFTRSQALSEFSSPMEFSTYEEQRNYSVYENYTVMSVTLNPVPGGNIKTHTILARDFQKY